MPVLRSVAVECISDYTFITSSKTVKNRIKVLGGIINIQQDGDIYIYI